MWLYYYEIKYQGDTNIYIGDRFEDEELAFKMYDLVVKGAERSIANGIASAPEKITLFNHKGKKS